MKLILCVDTRFGYAFNHRRQSSDLEMRRHLKAHLGAEADALFVNAYTERSLLSDGFFSDKAAGQRREHPAPSGRLFLENAIREEGWAFAENVSLKSLWHHADEILLYQWDKRYPADLFVPEDLFSLYELKEETCLAGRSHEEIIFSHFIRKSGGIPPR